MAENKTSNKKSHFSADWLVGGVLAKFGDIFDRFTGRSWKPSSSLATSELIERLKGLVDAEAKETDDHRRFAPHNIKLKMQWDKFSLDSDEALRKLEVELLTALVDHINDRRYYTYAPLSLEVKPDYFTSGVKLHASFDNADDEREVSIDVAAPHAGPNGLAEAAEIARARAKLLVHFEILGNFGETEFEIETGERVTVGRTKQNDLALDDESVSKMHASLSLKETGELVVADIGSTNGTFINGERIAYGKAMPIASGEELRFGSVNVSVSILDYGPAESILPEKTAVLDTEESIHVGEFEFTTRHGEAASNPEEAGPTLTGGGPASRILTPLTNGPAVAVPKNRHEGSRLEEDEKK